LASLLVPADKVSAATETWAGSTSANWLDANWSPNANVSSGDALVFTSANPTGAALNDDLGAGFSLASLTFNSGSPAYSISGNAFTLTAGITNSATTAQTISDAITFTNTGTANVVAATAGAITLSGNIATGSSQALGMTCTSAATSSVTLTGTDSFSSSTGNAFTVSGTSSVVNFSGAISATNTGAITNAPLVVFSTDTLNETGGTVQVTGGNTALGVGAGTGTLNVSGGTFEQVSGNLVICNSGSSSAVGVVNVSGTGKVIVDSTAGILFRNSSSSGHGTLNLNGGEFDTASPFTSGRTGNFVVFNGGTLKLTGNITSLSTAGANIAFNVSSGGALIDTNGFTTTISTPMTPTTGSPGGGLNVSSSSGSGVLVLSGANSYTGNTNINSGTLQIGAGAAAGTLGTGGGVVNNATLAFNRSDAGLTVGNVISGSGVVQQTGSGTTTLTAANTYSGTTTISAGTLQLGDGTNGHDGTINNSLSVVNSGVLAFKRFGSSTYSGVISGAGGVTMMSGSGAQTLSGANTYTGATNVAGGTLNITGSLASGTATTVAAGGVLTGAGSDSSSGILNGSVTVNGTLAVSGTSSQSLTINALTFNDQSSLSVATNGGTAEPVVVGSFNNPNGTLTLSSGLVTVPIAGISSTGTYTLAKYGAETGTGQFSFSNSSLVTSLSVGRGNYTLSDNHTSTLMLTFTGAVPGVAYYNGAVSTVWNDVSNPSLVNFSSDAAGATDAGNVPGASTDVILSAGNRAGTAVATTLGASTTINSLTVNNGATSTTINNDGSTLTINALADSNTASDNSYTGNPAGTGISITSGAGPVTINTPIVLGGNQSWTNASSNNFQVSNSVSGGAGGQTLTLANTGAGNTTISGVIGDGASAVAVTINNTGSGVAVFTGANTYSGLTNISAGTLQLGDGSAGHDGTIAGSSIVDNGALVFNPNGSTAYAGVISGTGSVMMKGTGTTTLSNANTYTGLTTVSQGTLNATIDASLGSSSAATAGLVLSPALGNTATVNFTSATPVIASLASSGAGTSTIVLGNTSASTLTTISIGGNNASTTYSGTIADGTATSSGAIGAVTKIGTGTLTLAGANSYTGNTVINAGTIIMANPMALGTPSPSDTTKTITVFPAGGGTLDVQTPGDGATPDGLYSMQENQNGTGTVLSDVPSPGSGVNHTFGSLKMGSATTLNFQAGPNVTGGSASFTYNSVLVFTTNGTATVVPTTASLHFGTLGVLSGSNKTFDLDGTNAGNSITGAISGPMSISKTNSSIWTLFGSSSYTGTTTIAGGILAMQHQFAFGFSSNVTVTGGEIGIPDDSYIADAAFNLTNYAVNYSGGVGIAFENYNSALNFTSIPTIRLGALSGTPSGISGNITGATSVTYTGPGSLTVTGAITDGSVTVAGGALTLAGVNTYAGNTTVNSGTTLNVTGSLASTNNVIANGTVNFGVTGSTAATSQLLSSLTIGPNTTATIALSHDASIPKTLQPTALTFNDPTTSRLDITNNILISTGTVQQAEALVSTLAPNVPTVITSDTNLALGYGDAGSGNYEIRATLLGDSDLDGRVNVADLANLAGNFGKTSGQFWINGDFDYNGNVNVADLADLAGNFGKTLGVGSESVGGSAASPAAAAAVATGSAVPEPTSFAVLGLGAAAASLPRRRRIATASLGK
jgi:autotransporter-associated beta strand protein